MFIRCDVVIFCSKTSFYCRCNVHPFIKNFAILFQRTNTTLVYYLVIEAFVAEIQLVKVFVVAAVTFTTETQHFRTPELLFEKSKLSLVMFLVLVTTGSAELNSDCISNETIGIFFRPQLVLLCFLSKAYTVF